MKPSLKTLISCSAFLGLAAGTYPVAAHHSTTMFDHATVVSIAGIVKEVHWTNPHVAIFVYGTTKDGGEPTMWLMEMTSPGNLVRAGGWTRTAVKPGDKVTVDFSPLRDGRKGGALKKITLVDTGQFLTADIRAQERANLEEQPPGGK
jgi:Family of unknown function (DUF6152)